jgi:FlaA1/EpsC-like NDP-sugar epimerase
MISTDKAINPASVMGASKWLAEQIIRSLHGNGTTLSAVRFGNVLGSRGSVIPTFFRQIARGGPITVTDPSMTRYFMSVQEAVQLVLQAAALSEGGEVFTLDMGEPVNIYDLARKVIRLSGRIPGRDVQIRVVGPRPGEKLVEELVDPDEELLPTAHPSIVVSRPPLPDRAALRRAIRELQSLARDGNAGEIGAALKDLAGRALRPVPARGDA